MQLKTYLAKRNIGTNTAKTRRSRWNLPRKETNLLVKKPNSSGDMAVRQGMNRRIDGAVIVFPGTDLNHAGMTGFQRERKSNSSAGQKPQLRLKRSADGAVNVFSGDRF